MKQLCDRWITEVEASTPSIVIRALDATGHDVVDVRVSVDGAAFVERLDGTARPLDPGAHQMRYQREGSTPRMESLMVAEGEKDRLITLRLSGDASAPPRIAADQPSPVPNHTLPYLLIGAGVASLGAFAYLAISGQNQYDDWEARGRPESGLSSIQVQRAFAWAALGVGVISSAVGIWMLATSSTSQSRAAGTTTSMVVGAAPLQGGGVLTLQRTF